MAPRHGDGRPIALGPGVRPDRVEGLWQRVDRNRVRAVAFSAMFVLVVALLLSVLVSAGLFVAMLCVAAEALRSGAALDVFGAMPLVFGVALAITLGWTLWRLTRSERVLLRRFGARIAPPGELVATKGVLKDVSIAAGFRYSPPLYVIDVDEVNAFALGRTHERAALGVTRGLVERIPLDEQRAVFANLMARIVTLDTLWATAVSVLMGPVWAMREHDLRADDEQVAGEPHPEARERARAKAESAAAWALPYAVAVVITELLSWWHFESAWTASEKADAEGMLLLKDPRAMLRALSDVLDRDNLVSAAGDAFSQLFYCWAGFGFAPEDDPEFRRVARLREVLGAEGMAVEPPSAPAPAALIPEAPRLEP